MAKEDIKGSEFEAAFQHGLEVNPHLRVGDRDYAIVRDGFRVHEFEDDRDRPTAKTGVINTISVKDFVEIVKREATESSVVFASLKQDGSGHCKAIIDFHDSEPKWCRYAVLLTFTFSPEWQQWMSVMRGPVAQRDMAEFIEDHLADVVTPVAADLQEVVNTLQAKTSVNFSSGVRLSNGDVKLEFVEETKTTAGKSGALDVPERLRLLLPIIEGFAPQYVDVAFRHRISDGKLAFVMKALGMPNMVRRMHDQLIDSIKEGTGLTVLQGSY